MSGNALTAKSIRFFSGFLQNNPNLIEVYLYWNKLSSVGGEALAEQLAPNNQIVVLELSHNSLGMFPRVQAGQKLIRSINQNCPQMRHLDLSHNSFARQDLAEMNELLRANRTIYGLHVEGNSSGCFVDARGFIRTCAGAGEAPDAPTTQVPNLLKRIRGVKPLGRSTLNLFKKMGHSAA